MFKKFFLLFSLVATPLVAATQWNNPRVDSPHIDRSSVDNPVTSHPDIDVSVHNPRSRPLEADDSMLDSPDIDRSGFNHPNYDSPTIDNPVSRKP